MSSPLGLSSQDGCHSCWWLPRPTWGRPVSEGPMQKSGETGPLRQGACWVLARQSPSVPCCPETPGSPQCLPFRGPMATPGDPSPDAPGGSSPSHRALSHRGWGRAGVLCTPASHARRVHGADAFLPRPCRPQVPAANYHPSSFVSTRLPDLHRGVGRGPPSVGRAASQWGRACS